MVDSKCSENIMRVEYFRSFAHYYLPLDLSFKAYSFGYLKSAKSFENGRLRKISVTKRMRILKTVELADFAEKNAKRMGILKK